MLGGHSRRRPRIRLQDVPIDEPHFLSPADIHAIAREHGGVPVFRRRNHEWEAFIAALRRVSDADGGELVVLDIGATTVLMGGEAFDELVEVASYLSPLLGGEVPREGVAQLAELEALAEAVGGAVGFRHWPELGLFVPVVVRIARLSAEAKVAIEYGNDSVMLREADFELMLAEGTLDLD